MEFQNDPILEKAESQMKMLSKQGVKIEGGSDYNRVFEAFYNLLKYDPTPEGVTAEEMGAQQAYDKTTELLKAYESGDLHGGKPMQFIEQYASLVSSSKDEEIARLKEDVKELVEGLEKMGVYFDKFMPKQVDTLNEKQMAMYGAYHTRKQLIQKHKL